MIAELPASERANAKIAIFTDKTVAKLPVMKVVEESLLKEGLNWVLWDKCAVEPTDKSWQVRLCYFLIVVGGADMVGSGRLDETIPNYSFPRCRWGIVHGHCQSCKLVQRIP